MNQTPIQPVPEIAWPDQNTSKSPDTRLGVVLFFVLDKNYGFIAGRADQENVFFLGNRQVGVWAEGDDRPTIGWKTGNLEPIKGDKVYYAHEIGPKGPRANWWLFKNDYDDALKETAARRTYRLNEHTGPERRGRLCPIGYTAPEVVWEGKNLVELRKRYKRSDYRVCDGTTLRRWFEVLAGDDQWERADDPR